MRGPRTGEEKTAQGILLNRRSRYRKIRVAVRWFRILTRYCCPERRFLMALGDMVGPWVSDVEIMVRRQPQARGDNSLEPLLERLEGRRSFRFYGLDWFLIRLGRSLQEILGSERVPVA